MKQFKLFARVLIFVIIPFLFLSFYGIDDRFTEKLDYSGTNSLFIKYADDGISFNWITNEHDSGYYQLKDQNDSVIKKGFTAKSRVHHTKIKTNISGKLIFSFGGKTSKKHRISLYPKPELEKSSYNKIDSIFVVGDVHGEYNRLINLLKKSNIIDQNLDWIAGNSHLVFLGDLFDRGNKVTKTLWFIYELEQQAKRNGGKVHLVLGNHEIMVMSKDIRYVSRKERNISIAYSVDYDYLFHPKKTVLGNWLKSKTSVLKIDGVLFAHGGVSDLQGKSIKIFNQQASKNIDHPAFLDLMRQKPNTQKYTEEKWIRLKYFFYGENSPYWYRGYVLSDTLKKPLRKILKKYDAKIHIVGHTPQKTIKKKYKGKLITTDLTEKATQLLLLVKKRNRYKTFRFNSDGEKIKF